MNTNEECGCVHVCPDAGGEPHLCGVAEWVKAVYDDAKDADGLFFFVFVFLEGCFL